MFIFYLLYSELISTFVLDILEEFHQKRKFSFQLNFRCMDTIDFIDFIRLKYPHLYSIPRCHNWYINKITQKTDYLN